MKIGSNHRLLICIFIILLLVNGSVLAGAMAEGPEPLGPSESQPYLIDSYTATLQILPGDMFYISYDPETMEISSPSQFYLPPECHQAIAAVPEWLKGNLTYKFRQLSSDFRTTYADLILNSPDPKYVDEIAFVIAHTSVENLEDDYFFPELITHNAQLVYENDQYLKYVEVVERGDYTTVIYKDKNNVSVELQKDIYYWYIVSPKLSDELATYVNPEYNYFEDMPHDKNYGTPPPTGKFWREWLFYFNDSGYPLLKEKLEGAYTVWEAISACNSWMSGSMSFTSDDERPIQPVRIYRKHIGRCGEYQDMRNAIARAGLIPSTCTLNSAEDHVWNEFWDGRWIHWDGSVDKPMTYENGWGKKISSVWNTKGDSDIWSVTEKYTKICNFTATVLDASGMPVDGALIRVSTEFYYNDSLLTTTTWGTTDYTGNVTIPLGDERNFWASAESDDLGSDPLNGVDQVITDSEAGVDYTHTFNLPMTAEQLDIEEVTPPGIVDPEFTMEVDYEVIGNIVNAENVYTEEHADHYTQSGNIDFFVADSFNYNLYQNGFAFDAYDVEEKSSSGDISFIIPDEDTYYSVLSNEFSLETTKLVEITVNIYSQIEIEITGPPDGSVFNQGETILITGTSWGPLGITSVEVDVDGSGDWMPVTDTSGGGEDPFTTWEIYLATDHLIPFLHYVQARATYEGESVVADIDLVLQDATVPIVDIENPIHGIGCILGEKFLLNGTVSDNGWIESMHLVVDSDYANATDITKYLSMDYWSFELDSDDLGYGEHTITIQATDYGSNTGSQTRTILVRETIDPLVSIYSPSSRITVKRGDTLELKGTASDNMEVGSLKIYVDDVLIEDILEELNSEDDSWTYSWITQSSFSSGEHILTVNITDGSGNYATDSIKVILDGLTPKTTITSPHQMQIFIAGETIEMGGTATDDWRVSSLKLRIDDGSPRDITGRISDGVWEYDLRDTWGLDSGEHTIYVTVTDTVNRESTASMKVIIDSEEPRLEFSDVDGSVEIGDTLVLSGTATDDIEITGLYLIIDDEEEIEITHKLVNGQWEYRLDSSYFKSGRHTFSLRAEDSVGNIWYDDIRIRIQEKEEIEEPVDISDGDDNQDFLNINDMDAIILLFIVGIILVLVGAVILVAGSRKKK